MSCVANSSSRVLGDSIDSARHHDPRLRGRRRLRAPCTSLIGLVIDGVILASTTIEVIQKFLHVRARRRQPTRSFGRKAPLASPGDH
jgi:hypothetical protein